MSGRNHVNKRNSLVVHCGGCMLSETQMKHHIKACVSSEVPIVNYGIAIAQMHIFPERSIQFYADILAVMR